ncbi:MULTISPECIES: hypothetical protein [unclassified Streptomyces]|uniref:hypothetical protein n=1 Tax=unclassified Streptomyces TaxID=2593676 RepID=UPI001F5B695E|nr:hypothetical protein [Streptomyces sp. Root1310]
MDGTDFSDDLLQTQRAWNTTYRALAAPRPRNVTALRRRLLRLSVRLWWHPYWTQDRPAGRSCAARTAFWSGSGEPAAAASDSAGRGDPPRDPPFHPGPRLRRPASVAYRLANLEERGALVRDGRRWQSCRLSG